MRTSRIVLFSLVATFLIIFTVTVNYPSLDDLFVENPDWNGLSEMYGVYEPYRLDSLDQWGRVPVRVVNSSLFIIGPSEEFSGSDVLVVEAYLEAGGRVVLMDDFGSGNLLLEGLGVGSRFDGGLLQDPLFFEDEYVFPVLLDVGISGVDRCLLNYPSVLSVDGGSVLGVSSPFSYLGSGPGAPGEGVEADQYPVIVLHRVGEGELILVSDSSLFINGMLDRLDNRGLLDALLRGDMMIDESHILSSRLTQAKGFFRGVYGFFDNPEVRYLLLAVLGVALFKFKWETEPEYLEDDPVMDAMVRHPGWDREHVARLHMLREREKIGSKRET